jgi:hypothetical protein
MKYRLFQCAALIAAVSVTSCAYLSRNDNADGANFGLSRGRWLLSPPRCRRLSFQPRSRWGANPGVEGTWGPVTNFRSRKVAVINAEVSNVAGNALKAYSIR